jgi:hypothetical protein
MTANPNAGLLDKVVMNETIPATYTAVNGLIAKATYDLIATTTDNLGALLYHDGLTNKQKRAIAKAHKALNALVVYPQADDDPFV